MKYFLDAIMQPMPTTATRKATPKKINRIPAAPQRSGATADEKTRRLIDAIKGLKGLR